MSEESLASGGSAPDADTATATVKATPTATVEAIAGTLVKEKPSVSEHAIEQARADAAAAVGKDKDGNTFNPSIHATNADGSPRLKANGAYALRRGKKPNGAQNAQSQKSVQSVKGVVIPGTPTARDANEQESRAAGVGAANMMFALFIGIGGAEWSPRIDKTTGLDEKAMMESAHADAFAAWGWGDLPPGLALCAAYAMYALPRLQMPQTKTRMQRFRAWVGSKVGAWKANRAARKRGLPESDVERADRESRAMYSQERRGAANA